MAGLVQNKLEYVSDKAAPQNIEEFIYSILQSYANVGGPGHNSQTVTRLYSEARGKVLEYFKIPEDVRKDYAVVFGSNAIIDSVAAKVKPGAPRFIATSRELDLPFGTAAIVVRRSDIEEGQAGFIGGAAVVGVGADDSFLLSADPDKLFQVGTPDIIGAIVLAEAMSQSKNKRWNFGKRLGERIRSC